MIHEHVSHHAYFAESRALFYRFLKTCTKYPHKVMSRIQRVAEYLMENIVFLYVSVAFCHLGDPNTSRKADEQFQQSHDDLFRL